jgi:hypothetical protein
MTIYYERRGCGHRAAVDLKGIKTQHGDDFRVSGFVARSRCSRCGARHPQVTIRVSPSYAPEVITDFGRSEARVGAAECSYSCRLSSPEPTY